MGNPCEKVEYLDGRIIFIGRLSRSRLGAMEVMLRHLQQRWLECGQITSLIVNDPCCWDWITRIASLFPRYDVPGKFGFDVEQIKQDIDQIERLFIADEDEGGALTHCKLIQLHQYEPKPRNPKDEEESKDLGFESSGDSGMDLLANLTCAFEGRFEDAWKAYSTLDGESLDRYLWMMGEMRRDPEERKQETLAADYAAWKQDNNDAFREGLGINFVHPNAQKAQEN